jgi:hypothetical protein
MPSDDRIAQALSALKRPRDVFHSAVVSAVEEVNAFLSAQRAPADERAAQESDRLGSFALGHIDIDRFSRLVDEKQVLDPARLEGLEHALRVLKGFAVQGDELYHVRVEEGADLRDTVRDALAVRGRAFSTAQLIEVLRTGHNGRRSDVDYGTLDFRRWSRAERLLAPPLVVEVAGSDLQVAGLAEYLDGAQKIVLVVEGPAAPAPLARLVAPRTFVMQTADPSALRRLASWDGPGIAALMPEGAVSFVHDPSKGESLARSVSRWACCRSRRSGPWPAAACASRPRSWHGSASWAAWPAPPASWRTSSPPRPWSRRPTSSPPGCCARPTSRPWSEAMHVNATARFRGGTAWSR